MNEGSRSDDEFVRTYQPFVRGIVKQTCAQLGLDIDTDDLVSCGFAGLLEARARFDASKGVPFKAFAHYRVRGAVIDGVRSMAYLPRRAYARLRAAEALDSAAETLAEQRAAMEASDAAPATPAQQLQQGVRAMDAVLGQAAAAFCASLATDEEGEGDASPEESIIERQRRAKVREAIASLPDKERFLIEGHYLGGRRFDELAKEAGLSKSWASRIHAKGLDRLRKRLAGM